MSDSRRQQILTDEAGVAETRANDPETTALVFADPVAYLARFGVEAEVVAESVMPVAA